MNINEMQAGPELEGLIHEKVMGKTGPAEPYSTEIDAAWKVVEELRSSFTSKCLCSTALLAFRQLSMNVNCGYRVSRKVR